MTITARIDTVGRTTARLVIVMTALVVVVACDSDDLDTDAEARRAYLGFDRAVDRGLELGLAGFNSASSANIDTQMGPGELAGTMAVDGQVDQGSSDNKGLRLLLTLVDYEDDPVDDTETEDVVETLEIVYDTADGAPLDLDLSLRDIPDGTFTGTLAGTATLSGDVDADATFALSLAGEIAEGSTAGSVVRVPGTLLITGEVTSVDGSFTVDIAR